MTEPERTPQTAPGLEPLREAERHAARRLDASSPYAVGALVASVEDRVRAEEQAEKVELAHESIRLAVLLQNREAERDAARAEVERLRAAMRAARDKFDATGFDDVNPNRSWSRSAVDLLLRQMERAALSTEAAQ